MANYQLKPGQEAFQVVDGPFEGRQYRPGVTYAEAEIPPREEKRFEEIPAADSPAPAQAEPKQKPKKEA